MLNRIEPLRNELDSLEQEASENRLKNDEMQKLIAGLEASIAKYKEEYAILISQAQAIKSDLVNVESKVNKFQKSELTMEVSGWVQVSLGIFFLGKSCQNCPKQVQLYWYFGAVYHVYSVYIYNVESC